MLHMFRESLYSFRIVVVGLLLSLFTDGYLDTLLRKLLAERRALYDTRELLGGEDLELVGEDVRQDGSPQLVQALVIAETNVDEAHS